MTNSSHFYEKAEGYSFVEKSIKTHVVQMMKKQEVFQTSQNLIKSLEKDNIKVSEQLKKHISSYISIRNIALAAVEIRQLKRENPDISDSELMKYIKDSDE